MADHFYFKFYYGVYLPKIAWGVSRGKGDQKQHATDLHKALKAYFDVSSTSEFNNHEFLHYLSKIEMILIREIGLMTPLFNESDSLNEMTMREWLDHCKQIKN